MRVFDCSVCGTQVRESSELPGPDICIVCMGNQCNQLLARIAEIEAERERFRGVSVELAHRLREAEAERDRLRAEGTCMKKHCPECGDSPELMGVLCCPSCGYQEDPVPLPTDACALAKLAEAEAERDRLREMLDEPGDRLRIQRLVEANTKLLAAMQAIFKCGGREAAGWVEVILRSEGIDPEELDTERDRLRAERDRLRAALREYVGQKAHPGRYRGQFCGSAGCWCQVLRRHGIDPEEL